MIVVLALVAMGVLGASRLFDRHLDWQAPISSAERYTKASFDRWLAEDPARKAEFAAFETYLATQGAANAVPNWQLLRTDINDRIGCPRPAFLMPPRGKWANILPVLRLVKGHVIPAVGPVEVVSSYRTEAFNGCVGGASQSRHLSFSGVDLVALSSASNHALFTTLCQLHRKLGPASRFGLGAYFDPARSGANKGGRFHVDATGYRSWGYSKKSQSSGCRLLEAVGD